MSFTKHFLVVWMCLNPYYFDPMRLLVASCYLNPRLTRYPITFYPLLCVTGPPFLQMCAAGALVYFECTVENWNNLPLYQIVLLSAHNCPTSLTHLTTTLTFGKYTGLHQWSKVMMSKCCNSYLHLYWIQEAKRLQKIPRSNWIKRKEALQPYH